MTSAELRIGKLSAILVALLTSFKDYRITFPIRVLNELIAPNFLSPHIKSRSMRC